jgi:hypothetical protein
MQRLQGFLCVPREKKSDAMLLVLFFAIVILLVILPSPTPRLRILVTEAAFTTTPPRCFHKVTRHLFEKLKSNNKQGNEEDINDAPPTTVIETMTERSKAEHFFYKIRLLYDTISTVIVRKSNPPMRASSAVNRKLSAAAIVHDCKTRVLTEADCLSPSS